jgi:hypothetical protein
MVQKCSRYETDHAKQPLQAVADVDNNSYKRNKRNIINFIFSPYCQKIHFWGLLTTASQRRQSSLSSLHRKPRVLGLERPLGSVMTSTKLTGKLIVRKTIRFRQHRWQSIYFFQNDKSTSMKKKFYSNLLLHQQGFFRCRTCSSNTNFRQSPAGATVHLK